MFNKKGNRPVSESVWVFMWNQTFPIQSTPCLYDIYKKISLKGLKCVAGDICGTTSWLQKVLLQTGRCPSLTWSNYAFHYALGRTGTSSRRHPKDATSFPVCSRFFLPVDMATTRANEWAICIAETIKPQVPCSIRSDFRNEPRIGLVVWMSLAASVFVFHPWWTV